MRRVLQQFYNVRSRLPLTRLYLEMFSSHSLHNILNQVTADVCVAFWTVVVGAFAVVDAVWCDCARDATVIIDFSLYFFVLQTLYHM